MPAQRAEVMALVEAACRQGARRAAACAVLGLSVRTLQRWEKAPSQRDGRLDVVRAPANKLSETERQQLLVAANQPRYAALPPGQIVPRLADEGRYLASESTFYRVLKAEGQLAHRQQSRPSRSRARPQALVATRANEIYSWDITYLPTLVRGLFFYLYLMLDIYSRKIVGWQVHDCESSDHAANLLADVCSREGVEPAQVTLHSDNGSPMKGATMLAMMQYLGVIPSFSRPAVSNDNPYSEALFRTVKYAPPYPGYFASLQDARAYFERFVPWYNEEHRHSGIGFVTPGQRHRGEDQAILAERHRVYELARARHPERWSGTTRNWNWIDAVYLNPKKKKSDNVVLAEAA